MANLSELTSLIKNLKLNAKQMSELVKNLKIPEKTCNICCDKPENKACPRCDNKVCNTCYSNLGKCPFCQDERFGAKGSNQVEQEYNQAYYNNFEDEEEEEDEEEQEEQQQQQQQQQEPLQRRFAEAAMVHSFNQIRQFGEITTHESTFNGEPYFNVASHEILISGSHSSVILYVGQSRKKFILKRDATNTLTRKFRDLVIFYHYVSYDNKYLLFKSQHSNQIWYFNIVSNTLRIKSQ
jgi:hypothetical protein